MTRLVWLFLFISVYWWSSAGVSTSPIIPPLNTQSKFLVVSWVLTRVSKSEFFIINFYFFVDFLLIWASLAIFFILYYSNNKIKDEINGILKFFFDLPTTNKLFLFSFTASLGIPNRIFVNHGVNSYLIFFIITCFFFIADELPFVTLALVFYFLLVLESLLFAYLYENDIKEFQKYVKIYLFGNNQEFAKKYFNFFWGNMDKAGRAALRTGAGGFMVRTLWNAVTENEEYQAQTEAERRVAKASQLSTKETSVEEVLKATETEKEKIMEKKAPFTNVEKKTKAFVGEQAKKFVDQVSGSESDESNEKKK